MDEKIGSVLRGGYRVINVLKGGMGVVYICHQEVTDQLYAVKTVHFEGSEHDVEGRLERFQNEVGHWIRISLESTCDHIVNARSFDADERLLILEYVDGLPLSALVGKGRTVHPRHFIDWARDIAEGMHELHARFHLIHRDLKPGNVLVSRKELSAKVTDLGIGKVLHEEDETHTLIGTPRFMAPECFEGRASFRSDIYSYGATLFWLLTGEYSVALDGPLMESSRPIPPKTLAVVGRCLQSRPEARFASFQEILTALEDIDETREFALDPDAFRFCDAHGFYSPRSANPEGDQCLFCVQQIELDRQMTSSLEAAALAKQRAGEETAAPGGASRQGTGTAFIVDPVLPPLSLPGSEGPGESMAPPAVHAKPRRLGGLAACAFLGVAILAGAWKLWSGDGGGGGSENGSSVSPGQTQVPPFVAGACDVSGCARSRLEPPARYLDFLAAHPGAPVWTSHYCAEHSPHVCSQCGRRYSEAELLSANGGLCETCGGADFQRGPVE